MVKNKKKTKAQVAQAKSSPKICISIRDNLNDLFYSDSIFDLGMLISLLNQVTFA